MSTNSSLSSNSSLPSFSSSSSSSMYQHVLNCMNSSVVVMCLSFSATNCLVLLPLCLFVFFLGFQRWRQQTSSMTNSPSDLITYHQLATELLGIIGWIICFCGFYTHLEDMMKAGLYLTSFGMQMNFHLLACIERYLAVVHPIAYLKLKKRRWILTRNVLLCYAWLTSFGINILVFQEKSIATSICVICVLVLVILIVFFCSMSVISVLIHSRPGDRSGRIEHVDKSKQRACYTIMFIMVALLSRLGGYVMVTSVYISSSQLAEMTMCGIMLSGLWFSLPSGLVLPLLFLHRAGKLPCCRDSKQ